MKKKGFSGIKDLDLVILNRTDDENIFKTCQTNSYIRSLCNENFWRKRFVTKYKNDNKPSNFSWREYYFLTSKKKHILSEFLHEQNLTGLQEGTPNLPLAGLGFVKPVYITQNGIFFFRNVDFGNYNKLPLNINLTETVGIGSKGNMSKLFSILHKNKTKEEILDILEQYLHNEIRELHLTKANFDKNNLKFANYASIIDKLVDKNKKVPEKYEEKLTDLLKKEEKILIRIHKYGDFSIDF